LEELHTSAWTTSAKGGTDKSYDCQERNEARDKAGELAKKWMNHFALDLVLTSTDRQFAMGKDIVSYVKVEKKEENANLFFLLLSTFERIWQTGQALHWVSTREEGPLWRVDDVETVINGEIRRTPSGRCLYSATTAVEKLFGTGVLESDHVTKLRA